MLPITIDLAHVRILLVGDGEAARRRLERLDEAGAVAVEVYAADPIPALVEAAGRRLRRRLPKAAEIARAQLIFLAEVADPAAAEILHMARAAGVLVNVEDDPRRSDFHSPSVLRRGDLTVAISTNGKSPALAALIRGALESRLGPEWAGHADEIGALRRGWREAGADAATVGRWTAEWAARNGWFSAPLGSSHHGTPRLCQAAAG
jgi:precorrin-2 dehydrogenase/sirohydrochlorin ferrochelatase